MIRKKHVLTQTEWEAQMALKILAYTRDALFVDFRYMGRVFQILTPQADDRLTTLAVDGELLRYSSEQLIRVFRQNDHYLNRLYFHSILHCLFQHLWIGGNRERDLWNTACDIAVEYVIDHTDRSSVKRILGWVREKTYNELEEFGGGICAAVVYRWLKMKSEAELNSLKQEFFADDHRYWPKEEKTGAVPSLTRKKWQQAARQISMEQKRQGDDRAEGQQLFGQQIRAGAHQRSYGDFLRKFAIYREEQKIDPDEFDLGFYTYGLALYGNLGLVEPVESREVHKIQDFVIVVDTSYSTNGDLVRKFVQETFDILTGQDSFFRKARILLLQCDEKVQKEDVINSRRDLEYFFENFRIYGGGGTDFRPAFVRVGELLKEGFFEHLCGLLYFTDGKGVYPGEKPPYPTAFLYLNDFEEEKVPAWAMRMQIDEESIQLS